MDEKMYLKSEDDIFVSCKKDEAEYVCLSKAEYDGLCVALDMVHRRALQQIDKSVADEHGYTLLRADKKTNKKANRMQWLITKTTPYSIKIEPEKAKELIELDLKMYYNYGLPKLEYTRTLANNEKIKDIKKCNIEDIYAYWNVIHNRKTDEELEKWSSDKRWVVPLKHWLLETNYTFTYDICKLSCNYAQGRYEVTYWGSKIV